MNILALSNEAHSSGSVHHPWPALAEQRWHTVCTTESPENWAQESLEAFKLVKPALFIQLENANNYRCSKHTTTTYQDHANIAMWNITLGRGCFPRSVGDLSREVYVTIHRMHYGVDSERNGHFAANLSRLKGWRLSLSELKKQPPAESGHKHRIIEPTAN